MFEFKMNNRKWIIKEISQKEIREELRRHFDTPSETGRYFGITYMDTHTIFLDEAMCEERKKATLLHELAHCYICSYVTHQDKPYNEEDIADIVSNSHEIIRNIYDEYFKKEVKKDGRTSQVRQRKKKEKVRRTI